MGWIAKDLPTLVFMLLPGFIAAGVFYSLTAHPKSSEFERLIQSLIFTSIIKLLTTVLKWIFLGFGRWLSLGRWNSDVEFVWSIPLAVALGLVFVWLANGDVFHKVARKRGLSSRTSYPSEWYGAFVRDKRWVILHLTDGRRPYGWPQDFPDQPDRGHFVINQPEWLLANNERAPLYQVERFLIPAVDVKMVEFLKESEVISQDPVEVQRIQTLLAETQNEESNDGSESPASGP